MRQLITRIDDDLHRRLRERARREGRSLNALATEALERAAGRPQDPRARKAAIRARAARAGVQIHEPAVTGAPLSAAELDRAIAGTRGLGPVAQRILDEDRGPRA